MAYDYDRPPSRPSSGAFLWPLLLVLILGAAGVAWFWHREHAGNGADLSGADFSPRPVMARGDLAEDEKATIELYRQASPSVVHITNLAERRDFFNLNVQQVPKGTGSGFIWSDDGLVVTNFHVVQGADAMKVILPDKQRTSYVTRVWMSYPDKDLAVLRLEGVPKGKLRPMPIGSSHDLQIGQKAFAIGNPFGLDQTLTTGIVSALNREIESATGRPISGVIQTSAAINPGNSGGPLLDSAGRLIGVNTAILSPSGTFAGIGFAIPVDEVNEVVPQLVQELARRQPKSGHGETSPPRLGIVPASDEQAQRLGVDEGVLILQVLPNGPAARAGLRPTRQDDEGNIRLGDVITAIDGQPVRTRRDLLLIQQKHKVGQELTLTIIRDEQTQQVKVTLGTVQV